MLLVFAQLLDCFIVIVYEQCGRGDRDIPWPSMKCLLERRTQLSKCTSHAHHMHITHTSHAHHMHITCTSHAPHTHITCISHALSDVLSLSYRSSYYDLVVDSNSAERQKSSGVLVYTGTGSTSWYVRPVPYGHAIPSLGLTI